MGHIQGEVFIHRPADQVFDFVADQRTESTYNRNMLSSEKITEGPIGVGTRFRALIRAGSRAIPADIEYTGFDRPDLIASVTHMSAAEFSGTLTFTPAATGTRLRWSWQVRPKGAARLLAPAITRIGARQERRMWTTLRDHLASPGPDSGSAAAGEEPEAATGPSAVTRTAPADDGPFPAWRLGRAIALATIVVGLLAVVVSVTTPPRSGPFCSTGCLGYPYTDAAGFVPRDYWWLYPQSVLILLTLALVVCVHHTVARPVRVFSAIATMLAAVAAAALLIDYAIQLTVSQPSLLRGETGALSLFSQYNPHGVFIALEDLGYLLLGVAMALLAVVFTAPRRLDRALRWTLAVGGMLVVAALPALAAAYGAELDYRYEVAAIALFWVALITGSVLLTRWFGRRRPTQVP